MPDLSIVILNYKTDGLLKNCLKSIYEHQYDQCIEVIVVDNDSGDGSEEMMNRLYPDVKFIRSGANLGHAKGNNIGIQASTGRFVMILNPDIVFLDPIFGQVVDFLDSRPDIGISTIQLKNPDGTLQDAAWRFHSLMTPLYRRSKLLQKTKRGKRRVAEFKMDEWDRTESREVDWVQGSCMIVRRSVIDQLGMFDERFFMYFTDVDWCRRCWSAGHKVYYYSDVSTIHYFHRQSADMFGVRSLLSRTTRIHISDWMKYLWKYH